MLSKLENIFKKFVCANKRPKYRREIMESLHNLGCMKFDQFKKRSIQP